VRALADAAHGAGEGWEKKADTWHRRAAELAARLEERVHEASATKATHATDGTELVALYAVDCAILWLQSNGGWTVCVCVWGGGGDNPRMRPWPSTRLALRSNPSLDPLLPSSSRFHCGWASRSYAGHGLTLRCHGGWQAMR
jgi:hypothetical protein